MIQPDANRTRTQTVRVRELSVSAFSPPNRRVREPAWFLGNAADSTVGEPAAAATNCPQTVRSVNCPRPRIRHVRGPSANLDWQRTVRVVASPCPSCRRSFSRFTSAPLPPMTSFDPATVRQAVAVHHSVHRNSKTCCPAKDVIAELRQRRASYRAIAETARATLPAHSKTAIAASVPSSDW